VTGGWKRLQNEELHKLYASPITSRMRWDGHVARIQIWEMHTIFWLENLKGGEALGVDVKYY
jgi:hypothetical protein